MLSAQKYGENLHVNYSPFGAILYGRNWSSEKYRYGFQGQERDDEMKGEGNSVNFTYRMHDPRLGRFFAVDSLSPEYPWNSPYAFSENRLVDAIELEGLEKYFVIREYANGIKFRTTIIEGVSAKQLITDNNQFALINIYHPTNQDPERMTGRVNSSNFNPQHWASSGAAFLPIFRLSNSEVAVLQDGQDIQLNTNTEVIRPVGRKIVVLYPLQITATFTSDAGVTPEAFENSLTEQKIEYFNKMIELVKSDVVPELKLTVEGHVSERATTYGCTGCSPSL